MINLVQVAYVDVPFVKKQETQKKVIGGFDTHVVLQWQIGFIVPWWLCLNLCPCKQLGTSQTVITNFITMILDG